MPSTGTPLQLAEKTADGWQWCLKRNCSASPGQVVAMFGLVSGVSLGVAGVFWMLGAALVLPFALLEVVALAVALGVYARHATDVERISLSQGRLRIEQEVAGSCTSVEFVRDWVQVGDDGTHRALVAVSGQGRRVVVGQHLRPPLRAELLRELQWALGKTRSC